MDCSIVFYSRSSRTLQTRHCALSNKSNVSEWVECCGCVADVEECTPETYCLPQATLEIEFVHQTLARYVSPAATKTLSELYNKISMAYARRPGDENLQENLDNVKKILAESRRATSIEFMCFRQPKEKNSSKATSGKPRLKGDGTPRSTGQKRSAAQGTGV